MEQGKSRQKIIVRTSIVGIVANVVLAVVKALIGILTNSIAITLDAVNNLSDGFSSVVTIIGTKLADKPADRDHPFGHGRTEYLSTMVISVVILYAGVTSFIESVKKILQPTTPEYTSVSLLIVLIAVFVKIILGVYVKKVGDQVNSGSLQASGQDAIMDAVISVSTLVAAGIYILFQCSLEAYLGAVISVIIMKSGYEMLSETISKILGERADASLTKAIKESICEVDGVLGAYDLVVHNYGPDRMMATVHIEVYDTMSASDVDEITRIIQAKIFKEFQVVMTGVGLYSINTKDDKIVTIREEVKQILMSHEGILQMHGFYLNEEIHMMTFDIVVSFTVDRYKVYEDVLKELKERFPEYEFRISLDVDMSD